MDFKIDNTLYWLLNREEASNLDKRPIFEEVSNLNDSEPAPSIIFEHLAPLLQYIAYQVVQ